ncbi:MAG: carbon-nitrogen hydrolase family protein [Anaerolineae bacterium]|nr:carbon-nitrogen hydrolase family protein [Anaerolineae bacterium]
MACARIATVCQGRRFYGTIDANRDHVLSLLDLALRQEPDLVCLPETFTTVSVPLENVGATAEPVPGPTTDAISERARAHGSYVICPIKNQRDGILWNSAIVIDREGQIAGIYDKAQPVTSSPDYTTFEGGVRPGPADVPVFDLDFGRIGIQICYDAGFPESWQRLADKGARLVFWPSAYNGGFPLQVYAYLHHYYVVSAVRTDSSRIIDPLGAILEATDERHNVIYRDINLDYCVCHYDFNHSIGDEIMAAYGERVVVRSDRDSGHFVIEPRDESVTIAALQERFGFEPTHRYHQRHRDAYPALRDGRAAEPQQAAHGARPMHAKW